MADVNGDGFADFVASGVPSSTTNYCGLYLWLNTGNDTYYRILIKDLFTEVKQGNSNAGDITCIAVGPTDGWATT